MRPVGILVSAVLTFGPVVQQPRIPVGAVAPAFTVADDRGVQRSLNEFRGKFAVLEWHEKGCPYVAKHYKGGAMQRLQRRWMERGVIWLLVSSSAEGAHSYLTPEQSRTYLSSLDATPTAMLLDVTGRVGQAYGVTTALHMVVIDPGGRVVYNGGIDDKPTTEAADLQKATNYVERALTELFAGRPVSVSSSVPYGCAVHYATGRSSGAASRWETVVSAYRHRHPPAL
jgi:peroxiredoxin